MSYPHVMPKHPEDTLGIVRAHERVDCQLYMKCLDDAARGRHRKYAGGAESIPCRGCRKYTPEKPKRPDPWGQPRDYNPWNG